MDTCHIQLLAVIQRDEVLRDRVKVRDSPLLVGKVLQKKQMPIPVAGNLGHLTLRIDRAARSGDHVKAAEGSLRTAVRQTCEQI